jgi:hypothetical protein
MVSGPPQIVPVRLGYVASDWARLDNIGAVKNLLPRQV